MLILTHAPAALNTSVHKLDMPIIHKAGYSNSISHHALASLLTTTLKNESMGFHHLTERHTNGQCQRLDSAEMLALKCLEGGTKCVTLFF